MNLKTIYEQLQLRVNKMDFNDLWADFKKYDFALYNDNEVILNGESLPKTEEFLANTSIFYEGRYIAIWNITDNTDIDMDILTSKIIHEMFHAFQNDMKEVRFANEFEAIYKYDYSPAYLQLKYNENLILADLISNFSYEKFEKFLAYRKLRKIEFPYPYNYENSIEAIEGSAQYVELQALKALSKDKYTELINQLKNRICDEKNLIPIRIISYDIGALILGVCFENNININLEIGNTKEIFYSELIEQIPYKKFDVDIELKVKNFYNEDIDKLKSKIDGIMSNCVEVIKGDFELLGFNVYSARFLDGYIYTTYFLMYKSDEKHTLYGNYLFKLENGRITEIYKE